MQTHTTFTHPKAIKTPAAQQKGVVLIIAIVMLILISVLTISTMRNATTTEIISSNTRQRELASQAANLALTYCEDFVSGALSPTNSKPIIQQYSTPPLGNSLTNWDSTRTGVFVLPLDVVNRTATTTTYQRAPECIVEPLPYVDTANANTLVSDKSYLITARGFGPEVVAGTSAPRGAEVWLQETVEY